MQILSCQSREKSNLTNATRCIRNNGLLILFILITLISMICGVICINVINFDTLKNIDVLFASDFDSKLAQPLWYTFISSLSSSFLFWALMVAVSASFLGPILVPAVLAFRSLGLGISAGYLYLIHEFKGVAFYILVLLPGLFISSIGFIFVTLYSFEFSLKVCRTFLPNAPEQKLFSDVARYLKETGTMLTILVASSLMDTLCMLVFSHIFSF